MTSRTLSRARAHKRAQELGCSFEVACGLVTLDAPAGHVFVGTRTHAVACGDLSQIGNEVWRNALYDMELGVERCEVRDCEVCEL